jgi:putative transposase
MANPVSYKRHRFRPKIIAHAVWLHFRFPLSLRLVEEMLLDRGMIVSYETVRRWVLKWFRRKFGGRARKWHALRKEFM